MNRIDFEEQLIEYVAGELPTEDAEKMAAFIRHSSDAAVLERDFRLLFEAGNVIKADLPPMNLVPQANAQMFGRLKCHSLFSPNGKATIHGNARTYLGRLTKPLWRPKALCALAILLFIVADALSGHTVIAQVVELIKDRVLMYDTQGTVVEEYGIAKVEEVGNQVLLHFADSSGALKGLVISGGGFTDGQYVDKALPPEVLQGLKEAIQDNRLEIKLIPMPQAADKSTVDTISVQTSAADKGWGEVKAEATNTPSR